MEGNRHSASPPHRRTLLQGRPAAGPQGVPVSHSKAAEEGRKLYPRTLSIYGNKNKIKVKIFL
ncbi:hypothetical protein E2C01_035377 [Portunus trituberculatus]|uniref:Uncharacterized protein n=1 Tax=Portunus trituberculatus TaxID=210409 RepID=A0A5B7FBB3_PORTR|nr:hypothetical protein [Portunus trituberculatus]